MVPMADPARVTTEAVSAKEMLPGTPAPGAVRASPKSRIFAPALVRKTFWGLRSRWTNPSSCARASPRAMSDPMRARLRLGEPPAGESCPEGLPLEELHDEIGDGAFASRVEERANIGMREPGRDLRFARESAERVGIVAVPRADDLERDVAIEPRVVRPIHLAHSSRAERGKDLVWPEARPSPERHVPSAFIDPNAASRSCCPSSARRKGRPPRRSPRTRRSRREASAAGSRGRPTRGSSRRMSRRPRGVPAAISAVLQVERP